MVDFQSRDTSRGRDDETEDGNEGEGGDEHEEEAAEIEANESTGDEAKTGSVDDTERDGPSVESGDTDPLAPDAPTQPSQSDSPSTDDVAVNEADRVGTHSEETHAHAHGHDGDHDDAHAHGHDGDHDDAHAHGHGVVEQLGVAVVTVSSTRGRENDPSGDAIVETVERGDHEVVTRDVVGDDLDGIQRSVLALTGRDDVDVVVTTGGTGVTPDDVTVEAITPLFDKSLPGFGELFRILSYEEVGTRALGSRATAGVSEGVPVFCLPGSENAVRLGMEELVVEEMAHLVGLATRDE